MLEGEGSIPIWGGEYSPLICGADFLTGCRGVFSRYSSVLPPPLPNGQLSALHPSFSSPRLLLVFVSGAYGLVPMSVVALLRKNVECSCVSQLCMGVGVCLCLGMQRFVCVCMCVHRE